MDFRGQRPKTGVENDIFSSEIGSRFGEPSGTCTINAIPPRIPHCPARVNFDKF